MFTHSQINMSVVLEYQPGKAIPQITMEILRKEEREKESMDEKVILKLTGVHNPNILCLSTAHIGTTRG